MGYSNYENALEQTSNSKEELLVACIADRTSDHHRAENCVYLKRSHHVSLDGGQIGDAVRLSHLKAGIEKQPAPEEGRQLSELAKDARLEQKILVR